MKDRVRKTLWLGFFAFVNILLVTLFSANPVFARINSDVLAEAPNGITVDSYMSNLPPKTDIKNNIYTTNFAELIDRDGNSTATNSNIVALANGPKTYGSMWSTEKSFDINKKQTVSAWLYFGSGDGDEDINSEGIAFVLQNDENKTASLGAGLEGIGVHGYDASSVTGRGILLSPSANAADINFIQNTAIENSVALEFDTGKNSFFNKPTYPVNNDTGIYKTAPSLGRTEYYSLDGYDTELGSSTKPPSSLGFYDPSYGTAAGTYGHIAITYPGYAGSYHEMSFDGNDVMAGYYAPWKEGYVLVHDHSKVATLTDGKDQYDNIAYWHHVTITWTPETSSSQAILTYSFNDKNLDYSNNNLTNGDYKKLTISTPIDTSKLNADDGKVYWGFTASNGLSNTVAPKLVAFDSIPDTLYANADANIVDTSLNDKVITDESTDNKVGNGDSLKLNYNLNYLSGNEDWEDIVAKIKIPDNVTITPDANNNVAQIIYNNDNNPIYISADDLKEGSLQYSLLRKLNSTDNEATITINATAVNNTNSDIDVEQAAAVFRGSNEISSTNSPEFTIVANPEFTLNLTNTGQSDIDLVYKESTSLDLPTSLQYSDEHEFDGENIIYQITAGNHTYTAAANATEKSFEQTFDLYEIINNDDVFWEIFANDTTIPVTVKAIDTNNYLNSNSITYNVNTKQDKLLNLTVSNDLKFKDINQGDSTEYLPRQGDFKLTVTSLKQPWQLKVSTEGLYLDGETLNDNMALVYRKDEDSEYDVLGDSPILVEQDTTSHDEKSEKNISKDWSSNTGLLLKQYGLSEAGSYTGTLVWSISDSVINE